MKIIIVGFNQKQKRALIYRQVEVISPVGTVEYDYTPALRIFQKALEKGATIISVRVLEEP